MLSISTMGTGQEQYYLELGRSDYYQEGGEPPGEWLGAGSEALGLSGRVAKRELRALFGGLDPEKGKPLVQLSKGHQPGWDLTFSAPKSVSLAWALGSEDVRRTVQECHDAAVKGALAYLEDVAAFTRRGRGGTSVERAGLCVAAFQHGSSRAQDPQLHTHALVLNVASRGDGGFGGLRSRDLYQHKMAAGAVYRAELAYRLRQSLGLEAVRDGKSFRLTSVPKDLENQFSKRREAIIQSVSDLELLGDAKACERAALFTREVKGHVSREQLFARWQREAGWGLAVKPRAKLASQDLRAVAREELSSLARERSFFLERDLVRCIAGRLQEGGAVASDIARAARATLEDSRKAVSLGQAGGYEYFTSKETLARERSVLATAEGLCRRKSHRVPGVHLEAVARSRPTLSDEQRAALGHLTRDSGGLACVEGLAGTGKTFLLSAAREAWECAGYNVLGAAVSARAALELEHGARVPSRTIARLLLDIERRPLAARDILVIDEAGMVGTFALERLFEAAREGGAKVCLVGDYRQLPAIEQAAPFKRLCEAHGAASLRNVSRQHELWERDALANIAEGDVRGGLAQYALAGRLHVAESPARARESLVQAWREGRTEDVTKTLVITSTNAERKTLNAAIQSERFALGEIDTTKGVGRRSDGTCFHAGDRVIFTRNERSRGFLNGDLGTVEEVSRGVFGTTALVRLDRHEGGVTAARVTVEISEDSFDLGYALTTHKAQGVTVDRAFVLGETAQSRELCYVQLSRARERTDLFITEAGVEDELSGLARRVGTSRAPMLAVEQQALLENMEESL